jgi:hypothetical protein
VSQFSDRAISIPTFTFREDCREREGYGAFSGDHACDFEYGFVPARCHHADRCRCRPALVRLGRRPNRPAIDPFTRRPLAA